MYRKKNVGALLCVVVALIVQLNSNAFCQDEGDGSGEAIVFFNKGQDAHEKGDLKIALENYEKALKILSDFPEAELQRGNAYQSLGKLDEAETAFRRAVELREDWSLALANLGSILVRKGRFGDAEKHLLKAIEIDSLNFPAYAALTELRLKTKAPPAVLTELLSRIRELSAKANPTASIWAARAALESAAGNPATAKLSFARALELDPKSQFALAESAGIALAEGDSAAAEIFIKRLEAASPQSQSTKALRARVLSAQGKPEEALALLNSITSPSPETTEIKNQLLASISTDTVELERQLATDPQSPALLGRLCIAFRTSDPAKALDYCRRASDASPQSVQPVIGYAAALVQAKHYDQAVIVLRKLLTIAPDNSTARANLATALFQLKRYAEAKMEFRWLADHQPDQAIAYYFLAIAHDQLLEFIDASANYQQFLRLADPESSKLEIEKVNLRLPVLQKLIKERKGKRRG